MAALLLGLSPILLIFCPHFRSWVLSTAGRASVSVSGCIGFIYLWRGMVWVNLFDGARAGVQRMLMGIWLALYAFVGSQMAWRLSPFVGDPDEPFVLLQPSHSNFYVDVTHALERTLGLHGALGLAAGVDERRMPDPADRLDRVDGAGRRRRGGVNPSAYSFLELLL
jgi:hypothetical protein